MDLQNLRLVNVSLSMSGEGDWSWDYKYKAFNHKAYSRTADEADGKPLNISLPWSDLAIDCTNIASAWKLSGHSPSDDGYKCDGTIRKEVIRRKALLRVEITLTCLVVLCTYAYFLYWRRARRRRKVVLPPCELEEPLEYSEDAGSSRGVAMSRPIAVASAYTVVEGGSSPAYEAEQVGKSVG
jgi:hypothetical protein